MNLNLASLVLACWSWGFCVAFSGCGDAELPDVNNEFAEVNFIGSAPSTGSSTITGLAYVRLFFDCTPRSVTVNGMMARVENTTAIWETQNGLDRGDITLAVEWLNRDGSEGKGAFIHYNTVSIPIAIPEITESTVHPGDKDVDAAQLNRTGITFRFHRNVRPVPIEIRPEGGKPLNWSAAWQSHSFTITPNSDEDKLLPGKTYVIKVVDLAGNVTNVIDKVIEKLSFEIRFTTKE